MRIISLLPSATEIVSVLGLDDLLVGVSEDSDWPAAEREAAEEHASESLRRQLEEEKVEREEDRIAQEYLDAGNGQLELLPRENDELVTPPSDVQNVQVDRELIDE